MTHPFIAFLHQHVRHRQAAETAFHAAWWQAMVQGDEERIKRADRLMWDLHHLFTQPGMYDQLFQWSRDLPDDDPLLHRQMDLCLRDFFLGLMDQTVLKQLGGLEAEAARRVAEFTGRFEERDVPGISLDMLLEHETVLSRRREAWEAKMSLGRHLVPLVVQMVALRNGEARRLGHPDWFSLHLAQNDLDRPLLNRLAARILEATDAPYQRLKAGLDREALAGDGSLPFHHRDPWLKGLSTPGGGHIPVARPLSLARRLCENHGMDIAAVLADSDLKPRPHKGPEAFSLCIDRGRQVRIHASITNDFKSLQTLLHECGHAFYFLAIDPGLPYLLRTIAHPALAEAVALFFEAQAHDLAHPAQAPAHKARELLLLTRHSLLMFLFEQELYIAGMSIPQLNARYRELSARVLMLNQPDGRDEPDWAAHTHLALSPVYLPNYLLGLVLWGHLMDLPPCDTPERLRRLCAAGAGLHWRDLMLSVCGQGVSPEPLCRRFQEET